MKMPKTQELDQKFEENLVIIAQKSHDHPKLLLDFVEVLAISIKKYEEVA